MGPERTTEETPKVCGQRPNQGYYVFEDEGPPKTRFQVTYKACGDSMRLAERVALLCWDRFRAGEGKEQVLSFRLSLYEKVQSIFGKPKIAMPSKRKVQEGEEGNEPEVKKPGKGKRDKSGDKAGQKAGKEAKREKGKGKK